MQHVCFVSEDVHTRVVMTSELKHLSGRAHRSVMAKTPFIKQDFAVTLVCLVYTPSIFSMNPSQGTMLFYSKLPFCESARWVEFPQIVSFALI